MLNELLVAVLRDPSTKTWAPVGSLVAEISPVGLIDVLLRSNRYPRPYAITTMATPRIAHNVINDIKVDLKFGIIVDILYTHVW